jgi:outer membrane murein-binding lipoprotein Lpp
MKAGYTQKIETAVLRVQQLQSKQKALENQMERYTDIAKRLAAVSEDTALSALLVNQLIERVTVNGPDDVSIDFSFEGGFERVMEVLGNE